MNKDNRSINSSSRLQLARSRHEKIRDFQNDKEEQKKYTSFLNAAKAAFQPLVDSYVDLHDENTRSTFSIAAKDFVDFVRSNKIHRVAEFVYVARRDAFDNRRNDSRIIDECYANLEPFYEFLMHATEDGTDAIHAANDFVDLTRRELEEINQLGLTEDLSIGFSLDLKHELESIARYCLIRSRTSEEDFFLICRELGFPKVSSRIQPIFGRLTRIDFEHHKKTPEIKPKNWDRWEVALAVEACILNIQKEFNYTKSSIINWIYSLSDVDPGLPELKSKTFASWMTKYAAERPDLELPEFSRSVQCNKFLPENAPDEFKKLQPLIKDAFLRLN